MLFGAAKKYGQWKNNQNYFSFLLYCNSLAFDENSRRGAQKQKKL
jgi:hypothetical protein